MVQSGKSQKLAIIGVCAAIVLSATAFITGTTLPATNNSIDSAKIVTYDAVAPYIKEFLAEQEIVDTNGNIAVPDTNAADGISETTIESAVNDLITTGNLSYLQANNCTTATDVPNMLAAADNEYVAHQEFANVLHENLKAGDGITISADNTITATMFVMTANRLEVSNPDPGKIYVETGVNASSPVAQYIYIGGQNGAPADPTQPGAWLKVGDLRGVDLSSYSTTEKMKAAITGAIIRRSCH